MGESQTYKANGETKNEFSGLIDDVEYVTTELEKSDTYNKGFMKYIDREILG